MGIVHRAIKDSICQSRIRHTNFMRNVLAQVSYKDRKQVAEAIKLIHEQPDQASATRFLECLAQVMAPRWPKVAQILLDAEDDILAYKTFPKKHHRSIHSVNPLERLNREIRRRTWVVGYFLIGILCSDWLGRC